MSVAKTFFWPLAVSACLVGPQARAQALQDGCASPEIRGAVMESLTSEPICDHYSPETTEPRRKHLQHLQQSYPACYASISSDSELQNLKREMPLKIAALENEADSDMERAYNTAVRQTYVEQCKKLADATLSAIPAPQR
jgi:hypothetical protein